MDESLFAKLEEIGLVPEFRSMRHWQFLTCISAILLSSVSLAGPFRKNKPDPEVYVPALINVLKTEKDEKKRADAADELGEFDGKAFPAILPALIDALANDSSSSVRAEAAESIANIRPMSSKAAYALEQAAANDKSFPVRLTAKTSLLHYRLLGYVGGKSDGGIVQSAEPPIAINGEAVRPAPIGNLIKLAPTNPTLPPSSLMPLPVPQAGPREPSNNTSMFPFLNKLNPFSRTPSPAPSVIVKDRNQTNEPPISRPTAPAPKKDFLVDEPPPVPPRETNPPALTIPSPGKTKGVLTGNPKQSEQELPKPAIEAPSKPLESTEPPSTPKPVLVIPAPVKTPVVEQTPMLPILKPVPGTVPPDDGPRLPAPPM